MKSSSSRGDRALPWFVFSVFVVLTAMATWYVWRTSRDADRARFHNAVQATRDAIAARLATYTNLLTAARGLVILHPTIPPEHLRLYIRSLDVQQRYPGIQGIGLSIRVAPEDVSRVEQQMRNAGYPEFRVWPHGSRREMHAIVLLEPLDRRNRAAMGYDMSTNPVRAEAMARARDTGTAAASGRVTLVQEIDQIKQAGFLIYSPLYIGGEVPPTVEERRAKLLGFIYAPFRAADLLRGIFGTQEHPEIGFIIDDNGGELYRTPDVPPDPRFTSEQRVEVAGRPWHIRWFSRREGFGNVLVLSTATFLGGLVISLLLFMLVRVQLQAREQAERTAETLRESEAALQEANRAKDEFLATLSHELRTPMTAIMGWSQMLAEESLDAESAQLAVDAIRTSARAQAQLIDDLLDVSRITAGKMRIESKSVDLAAVVSAAIDTTRAAAEAKGVHVSVDLATDAWVRGDAHRLQQVLWNLLSNAVKFTPAGGQVRVSLRTEGREAVIDVTDDGQGIDPAFMPFLFERFRQADSSPTRTHMGLGLGLAIVRHLVELHGGTISAESRGIGRGATFRVRLPLAPRDAAHSVDAIASESDHDLRGVRVLVVDDDEQVRTYVAAVFRGAGADVTEVTSAREAIACLDTWPADIVLTDLAMPHADGYDLLEWIRASATERVRNVPVVAISALATADDRQRAEESGFQGFVAKPVEPGALRAAVMQVVYERTS